MTARLRFRGELLRQRAKSAYGLIDAALDEYSKDRGELVAAALAFYTLLSIAPLIIIAVAMASIVLGEGRAREAALGLVSESMGPSASAAVAGWVDQASESGGVASLIGFLLVAYTASRLGAQLRSALNQVWNVDELLVRGFKATIRDYLKRRLAAFLLVMACGPVLLVVFASRALLTGFHTLLFAGTPWAGTLAQLSQLLFSLVLVFGLTAVVFKVVPDTRVGWRAILPGAALTSLLFNFGNALVGLYLGRATVTEAYGAASSAVVVLLWLYFSAQMFLFGAEFTQVYAKRYGRGLSAKEAQEVERARSEAASLARTDSTERPAGAA